jgi:cytochrome c556
MHLKGLTLAVTLTIAAMAGGAVFAGEKPEVERSRLMKPTHSKMVTADRRISRLLGV